MNYAPKFYPLEIEKKMRLQSTATLNGLSSKFAIVTTAMRISELVDCLFESFSLPFHFRVFFSLVFIPHLSESAATVGVYS